RVCLLERDNRHAPGIIDADDVRDTERFELIPDENAARGENAAAGAEKRRRTEDDRIVAIEYAFDHGDRRRPRAATVVARHFTEWSFNLRPFIRRQHFAFEYDLGHGWNRQIRCDSLDHFHRRAAHPAGETVLGNAPA